MLRPAPGVWLALALTVWLSSACAGGSEEVVPTATPAGQGGGLPFRATGWTLTPLPVGYRLETVLEGLDLPTSLAATPDGRLLITEQTTGRVRVVQDGRLLEEPWFELPVYFVPEQLLQELGLVSIAVDPLFEQNRYVYIYYTERDADGARPDGRPQTGARPGPSGRRTVFARLRDVDGRGTDLTELVTIDFAPRQIHIAGGIAFDGKDAILLGVGDHERPDLAPRLDSPVGKVLRIDREGNALPDNPFVGRPDADPRVYAYGVRNPFGLAVDRASGRKFMADNRETLGDAVYELVAGADYGWPTHRIALREPLVIYNKPMGMAGALVYNGTALPAFTGDLFYCTFDYGGALHWSEPEPLTGFDLYRRDRIIAPACASGITEGADGFIYFLSYGHGGKLLRISR